MRQIQYFIFFLLLFLTACVKDEVENPVDDHSLEYFPLIVGKYITYEVDSLVFDDVTGGNSIDTIQFQLREEISGFEVINGDTVFYIHRFRKDDPNANWQLKDVWTTRRTPFEALKTEENLTFRKLIFPLRDGRRWLATSYINPNTAVLIGTEYVQPYQFWEAEVTAYDVADQIGSFTFDSGNVMHVSQSDSDDFTGYKRYVMEKYVRGIGLVQRADTILDSKCLNLPDISTCIGKPWIEIANKGYILSQIMIDHN